MKKVIAVFLICACVLLGAEATSAAAMLPDPGVVHPTAQECGNCGKMTFLTYKTYTEWALSSLKTCGKDSTKKDEVYTRFVRSGYRCSSCGYVWLPDKYYESKIVCNH